MEDNKNKPATAEAPKRRTRGPNKPKPAKPEVKSIITVETKAVVVQNGIVELLTEHVAAQLGTEAAVGMELQVNVGDGWVAPSDTAPHGTIIRFATKGSK